MLNGVVEKVNDVVKEKIEKEVATIHDLILFDDKFTSGTSWDVAELFKVPNHCKPYRTSLLQLFA